MTQARKNFSRPYYRAGFTGWFRGLFGQNVITHPGTVTGSTITASVKSAVKVASVNGSTTTPGVKGSTLTASVQGDLEAPSVKTKAKPLV